MSHKRVDAFSVEIQGGKYCRSLRKVLLQRRGNQPRVRSSLGCRRIASTTTRSLVQDCVDPPNFYFIVVTGRHQRVDRCIDVDSCGRKTAINGNHRKTLNSRSNLETLQKSADIQPISWALSISKSGSIKSAERKDALLCLSQASSKQPKLHVVFA